MRVVQPHSPVETDRVPWCSLVFPGQYNFMKKRLLLLALCVLAVSCAAQNAPNPAAATPDSSSTKAEWRPQLLFGGVNFHEQLAKNPQQWQKTAARMDGMLLHLHFWVRDMRVPDNAKIPNADATKRAIAPSLRNKNNIVELTYHIRDTASSPEAIGRDHAAQVERLEKEFGIPISAVNSDWIIDSLEVQKSETPRAAGESDDVYFTRILSGVLAKSARYVAAFRAAGRTEKLIAVFPPIYLDEGPWSNVRKAVRPGITTSRILNGLFDHGFDGFTADSPYYLLANADYRAAGYYDALRSIEWTCRQRGKSFGFIINGDNPETDPQKYDATFARTSLEALELVRSAGLRPNQIVFESWFKGPFQLVPETQKNTFANTLLEIGARLNPASPTAKP